MLTQVQRALSLIQIVLAAALGAVPGAAKTVSIIEPAVQKATALLTIIGGFAPPTTLASALDDLAALVTQLHVQGLVPPSALYGQIEGVVLKSDAAVHNFTTGQAVPIAPLSIEGTKGFLYAIPDGSTVSDALGR